MEIYSINYCLEMLRRSYQRTPALFNIKDIIIFNILKGDTSYEEIEALIANQLRGYERTWMLHLLNSCDLERYLFSVGYQPMENYIMPV